MSTQVDSEGLTAVASALRTAGSALDESLGAPPSATDAGVASGLLASVLATIGEAGLHLTYEAHHVAGVADACNADYAATDSIASANLDALAGSLR